MDIEEQDGQGNVIQRIPDAMPDPPPDPLTTLLAALSDAQSLEEVRAAAAAATEAIGGGA